IGITSNSRRNACGIGFSGGRNNRNVTLPVHEAVPAQGMRAREIRRRSAARELHDMTALAERPHDLLAVIALYDDGAVLDGAAGSAEPLQLARQRFELLRVGGHAVDRRDGLAAATLLLAAHAYDAVAPRRAWLLTLRSDPADAGGVHDPVVAGAHRVRRP